jgi:hypothetical protein
MRMIPIQTHNILIVSCFLWLSLLLPLSVNANLSFKNDAAMGSDEIGIPEPLVFDLVRPLGSPKGEIELNLFANHNSYDNSLSWSPEIEYVFADGYAVELELPYNNSKPQEYKVAFQGTFGTIMQGNMIHGWQLIARKGLNEQINSSDLLYLNGVRISKEFSTMNMIGIRKPIFEKSSYSKLLINNALFFHTTAKYTLGVEVNHEINESGDWRYRLTPQIHVMINQHRALQLGFGPSTLHSAQHTEWISAARFSYSF